MTKQKGWLDKYGEEINANEGHSSAPKEWIGEGYSNVGRNYSPAWGGQFAQGGNLPGAMGNMYARIGAPSNGKYAKKTLPSAQAGSWVEKAANAEFSCAANPRSNLRQSYSEYCDAKKGLDKDEYKALKKELSSSSMKDLLNVEEYYVLKNLADNQNRKMGREDNAYSKYFDQSTGLPIPNLTNELNEEGNLRATNRMYPGRKNLLVNDVYQGILKDYNITTPQTPAQTKALLEKAYNIGYAIPKQQDGGFLPKAQVGKSLENAKMKAKMALAAEFGNPSAKRMTMYQPPTYTYTGREAINNRPIGVSAGGVGTHYMSSMDNFAVPFIQQDPSTGKMFFNPKASGRDREAMRFDNPQDAEYFAEHYKEVAPMMKSFQNGGWLDRYAQGGVIKDNNGYWNPDNWGKTVEIDSPNITMEDVYQPLIGISKQTGEEKLMFPGENHTFANTNQVIEKPLNKKSRGWLDKYN